ncbi:MAG: murein biosynthesis integral membrane protein MurJ [Alphaproteobacteria bacterium]|nr:murein biosynthesis integral membrane protein MurJ [Alphaproteobacteria bacterium]
MGIIRAACTVGGFTLFSRLIGYVRECLMASILGANLYSDALLVALRIANTFRRIFAEGAFNASFLPRFAKVLNVDGKDESNALLAHIFSFLLISLCFFSCIILYFFPAFLEILVSGFDVLSKKFELSVRLGRICFPYLILISLSSLFSGVLNTINRFALPAALYSFLSICTGTTLVVGYYMDCSQYEMVHWISYSVLISGILQTLWLLWSIKNYGFGVKFTFNCWNPRVKDIAKNMIPGIIGAGVWQLNMIIDMTMSSYLPTGTITCLNLAERLNQFPLGTFGIALSTALLPMLSKLVALKDYTQAQKELERGLIFTFLFTFLALTLMLSLNEIIVAVAFQRGLFGAEQAKITAEALKGLLAGLPAYVLSKVYSAAYFAQGDTKTPVILAAVSLVANVIFLIVLVPFLKYFGLAVSASLAACIYSGLLFIYTDQKLKFSISREFVCKISAQIVASVASYFSLIWCARTFWTEDMITVWWKWGVLFLILCFGTIIFILVNAFELKLMSRSDWKIWTRSAWD